VKKSSLIIPLVAIVLVAGAAFVIFHKSNKPAGTATSASSKSRAIVPAVNNAVLITKTNASLGQYLAKPSGEALYTNSGDSSGVSNCTGSCISDWPPYQDTGSTANLPVGIGTIKRSGDGNTQYTYSGMPLYAFAGDSNGQVSGDGQSGFTVARPVANPSTASDTAGNPNTSSSNNNW
jgi:predicted lipoprotein with Yx(FWY)xxD motif